MRAVAILLVLALVGCRGANTPKSTAYLANVEVHGNSAIESDEILEGLGVHRDAEENEGKEVAKPVDPYLLSVDVERVRVLYQKFGYFSVEVKSRIETRGLAQTVHFDITEGKRAKTYVVLAGLPEDVDAKAARAIVELADGEPFDYEKFDDAKEPLVTFVENAGYAHVVMDAEVLADKAHGQATIRFVFDPGPVCAFGDISITGVDGDLAEALRARVWFKKGERYSAEAMAETQREIYDLGRFTSARVEPERNSGSEIIPVRIIVVEATRYESKVGGGFGYEPLTFEARARLALSAAKVPDTLSTASLDFRPAYTIEHDFENPEPKIRLLGTLRRIDLFLPLLEGELEGGLDYTTVEAYTSVGGHARLGGSFPLGYRWLRARLGYLFEQLKFSKFDSVLDDATKMRLGLDEPERLAELQASIAADLRDDPIAPHKGVYLELRASAGSHYLGSNFDLVQITPEVRGYIPLHKTVLALRARLGMIYGDVPVTERYFTGGASSHRGFSERRLSPSIAKVPIGGAALFEAGIELRGPTWDVWGLDLGGVLFLDAADVTEERADLDLGNLHYATGFGLRLDVIKSVVARLDLGYRLNRLEEPIPASTFWDRLALHLGVGQAF